MSDDSGSITVHLTLTAAPSSPRVPLTIEKSCNPSQLRQNASEATKIPLSSLKLIFRGRLIADDSSKQVVDEYKLENESVLHCMGKPAVGDTTTASVATPAPTNTAAGSSVSFVPPPAASAPAATTTGGDPLEAALNTLRSSNSPSVYLTAVTTLEKVLGNCVDKPMEEKYRTVKKQNAAFQKRLGSVQGGEASMLACGFVIEGEGDTAAFVLHASPEAWPKLVAAKQKVSAAVVLAKSAAAVGTAPQPAAGGFGGVNSMPPPAAGMPGGIPGGMGMPPGGVPPNMQQAMSNLMSDPNALGSMLQNPMVRNMLQNDPRFANNPQMRQSLDALASNPQMLNQVSSMMSDPAMQAQMQSMMNAQGMNNMPGMGSMPPANATANNAAQNNASGGNGTQPNNSNNNNAQDDQEMTEEEMLQEAIQRSLRES